MFIKHISPRHANWKKSRCHFYDSKESILEAFRRAFYEQSMVISVFTDVSAVIKA